MAYFEDGSRYRYGRDVDEVGTSNVGWLEAGHDYPRWDGPPPEEFLRVLWFGCTQQQVRKFRGFHECSLCDAPEYPIEVTRDGESHRLGYAEVRVLAADGERFAAPHLVYHYVVAHQYRPPDAFVEAVQGGRFVGDPDLLVDLHDAIAAAATTHRRVEIERVLVLAGAVVEGRPLSAVALDELTKLMATIQKSTTPGLADEERSSLWAANSLAFSAIEESGRLGRLVTLGVDG